MTSTCMFSFFPLFFVLNVFLSGTLLVSFECPGEYKNKSRNSKSWSGMVMPKDEKKKLKHLNPEILSLESFGEGWWHIHGKSSQLCLSDLRVKYVEQNFKNSRFGIRNPEFSLERGLCFGHEEHGLWARWLVEISASSQRSLDGLDGVPVLLCTLVLSHVKYWKIQYLPHWVVRVNWNNTCERLRRVPAIQ